MYGDSGLTSGLNANFSDMWNRRHFAGNDYYDAGSGRGYYLATAADAYASPEGQSSVEQFISDSQPFSMCIMIV